jgi:hypothetical protein
VRRSRPEVDAAATTLTSDRSEFNRSRNPFKRTFVNNDYDRLSARHVDFTTGCSEASTRLVTYSAEDALV